MPSIVSGLLSLPRMPSRSWWRVRQPAEVADEDRHAVALGDHDVAEVRKVAHQADAADDVALLAAGDAAAAGVGAVVVDGGDDVVQADAIALELHGVELELELHGEAAEVVDIGHARHLFERRDDDPALDLGKLHQVLAVGFQRVAVDFAGRARHRVEAGLDAGGQGDLAMRSLTRWRAQ